MSRAVVVTTGSRLHFGLFAHGKSGRREFGGVGVMIDQPGFIVRGSVARFDQIVCAADWRLRIETVVARLRDRHSPVATLGPLSLELLQSFPAHSGLGSGTQLAMAVAKVASVLAGEHEVAAEELARRSGRGLRSALGLYGFQHGGLMVEAGKTAPDEISPLVARVDLPAPWRFVLARPRRMTGLSGIEEAGGFSRLAPMPMRTTDRLCRIALMEILPAAMAHDYSAASESIGQFGRLVGEYFAPVQGGVFADERIRRIADLLAARNIRGVGQSSWGPTLFILCPDIDFARSLLDELAPQPEGADCEFQIAAPLNRGATCCEPS